MNNKVGFFKKVAYSFIPPKYRILGMQTAGSVVGFVFLFSLLLLVVEGVDLAYVMTSFFKDELQVNSTEELIDKYVPDFTIQNGKLGLEEPVDIVAEGVIIHIDDSVEEITMSDVDYLVRNSNATNLILGSQTNLITYTTQGEYNEYKFAELGQLINSKQSLIDVSSQFLRIMLVTVAIIMYIAFIIRHFFVALCYFLLLVLLNAIVKRKASAGNMYTIAVFAYVPALIFDLLITLSPVNLTATMRRPVDFVLTVVIAAFGLFSVHEANEQQMAEKYKFNFDDNPYRVSGFVPDNAASMGDDNFGGYAAISNGPVPSYNVANGANTKVRLKGVEVSHADLELIDRYIKGNLKDLAIQQLVEVSGLPFEDCREIVGDWNRYYY